MGRTVSRTDRPRSHQPPVPAGAFALTEHALEQLRARHMPALNERHVRFEAKILARTARRTENRTPRGEEIWVATDGYPIEFVVKNDQGRRVCVTVLPRDGAPE